MDPARKKRIRLVAALTAAVLLASALIYTSFSGATEATSPSQLLHGSFAASQQIDLTGKVAAGSVQRNGEALRFAVQDRAGGARVPVTYSGVVPDPFRVGREVVVTGHWRNGTFVGERDSLVTKCPSKYQAKPGSSAT